MNRKDFLKSILSLVGTGALATTIPDLLKPREIPAVSDVPGIGGQTMKIKMDRTYFQPGDMIVAVDPTTMKSFDDSKNRGILGSGDVSIFRIKSAIKEDYVVERVSNNNKEHRICTGQELVDEGYKFIAYKYSPSNKF